MTSSHPATTMIDREHSTSAHSVYYCTTYCAEDLQPQPSQYFAESSSLLKPRLAACAQSAHKADKLKSHMHKQQDFWINGAMFPAEPCHPLAACRSSEHAEGARFSPAVWDSTLPVQLLVGLSKVLRPQRPGITLLRCYHPSCTNRSSFRHKLSFELVWQLCCANAGGVQIHMNK